jgi:hypothetical protein
MLSGQRDAAVARYMTLLVTFKAAAFLDSLLAFSRASGSVVQHVYIHCIRMGCRETAWAVW